MSRYGGGLWMGMRISSPMSRQGRRITEYIKMSSTPALPDIINTRGDARGPDHKKDLYPFATTRLHTAVRPRGCRTLRNPTNRTLAGFRHANHAPRPATGFNQPDPGHRCLSRRPGHQRRDHMDVNPLTPPADRLTASPAVTFSWRPRTEWSRPSLVTSRQPEADSNEHA